MTPLLATGKRLGAAMAILLLAGIAWREIALRGPIELGLDQEEYLAAGAAAFERGLFFWKAPLYSLWLAPFHAVWGGDLTRYAAMEKAVSVLLFALAMGELCRRLVDGRTGLLAVFWVLQCKYLLNEPNNSHTLTAILIAASALCLTLRSEAARFPVALFALFLSCLVRSEMRSVLGAFPVLTAAGAAWERRQRATPFEFTAAKGAAWAACLLLALSLCTFFQIRRDKDDHYDLIEEAFTQNFAANYVERNGLQAEYPSPWKSCHEIRRRAMPDAPTIGEAIRRHPAEVGAHIRYNIAISLRAIPASVLGIARRGLWGLVALAYLASYLLWRPSAIGWQRLSDGQRRRLIALSLSLGALVLTTWFFRAAARYYIQLIPALLPMLLIGLHLGVLRGLRTDDQRHSSGV